MATKTTTRKLKPTNTPAPTAEQRADVLATGAAPAAPQAATLVMPATPPEEAAKLPPAGDAPNVSADLGSNTSAADADVSATGAAPVAPQAAAPDMPALQPEDAAKLPPAGETQPDLKVTGVYVVARQEGFRRAGRAWSVSPTTVPIDELTEEQIDALVREPMLRVAFIADTDEKVAG